MEMIGRVCRAGEASLKLWRFSWLEFCTSWFKVRQFGLSDAGLLHNPHPRRFNDNLTLSLDPVALFTVPPHCSVLIHGDELYSDSEDRRVSGLSVSTCSSLQPLVTAEV